MSRVLIPILAVVAVLFAVVAGAALLMLAPRSTPVVIVPPRGQGDPATPDQGWEGVRVPEFSLTTADDQPVDATMFDGRVTIIDFFFTHCPFVCPGMSAQMLRLSEELKDTGVRFASFSVDPENDTPARLREYRESLGADPERWRFVTGPVGATEKMARELLQFEMGVQPETPITLPDGRTMSNIIHPSHLVLIGPDRQVLGIYTYQFIEQIDQLRDRARALDAARR